MSAIITSIAVSGALGAGASLYAGSKGSKSQNAMLEEEKRINELNYRPEPKQATSLWWEKLQQFGNEPGYGAITPDGGNIWESAKEKIRSYYSGTATQTGAIDKIKASAARRGVADSPALEAEITKALAAQGSQMSQLARDESIAKADFSEKARLNWLQNLNALSQGTGGNMAQVKQYEAESDGVPEAMSILGTTIGSLGTLKSLKTTPTYKDPTASGYKFGAAEAGIDTSRYR